MIKEERLGVKKEKLVLRTALRIRVKFEDNISSSQIHSTTNLRMVTRNLPHFCV